MITTVLSDLFRKKFKSSADTVHALPVSGSARRYFRIKNEKNTAIGVFNKDIRENQAFIYFSRHFLNKGLAVPQIYETDENRVCYLIEDLGDLTLKEYSDSVRNSRAFHEKMITIYKDVLAELVKFQIKGHEGLDYSYCVPSEEYDKQSILWDLNHFKYFFLKVSGIPFDEQALELDFIKFANFLSEAPNESFMFRDFQSRNIMLHNDKIYFIDYQGGRKGALQYDPASLLFEAKAAIPSNIREELLDYYLVCLTAIKGFDRNSFFEYYYPFALIRVLQALGAYGLRGIIEKKPLFLQSIPQALENLSMIIRNIDLPFKTPELARVADELINHKRFTHFLNNNTDKLTVRIFSFSYRKGIPDDLSGNGGGFVFDCRGVNNPGRYPEYRALTGKDPAVQEFIEKNSKIIDLIHDAEKLITRHIEFCIQNGYTHMQLSFGCTGGKHRSVYAAEKIAARLKHRDDINLILQHTESESFYE